MATGLDREIALSDMLYIIWHTPLALMRIP